MEKPAKVLTSNGKIKYTTWPGLGITEETPIHSYEGWQTVKLTTPVEVNEGVTIWLALVFLNCPGYGYKAGTPARATSTQTWAGGMPATFGFSTIASYTYNIYANYTPDERDEDIDLPGNPYTSTNAAPLPVISKT